MTTGNLVTKIKTVASTPYIRTFFAPSTASSYTFSGAIMSAPIIKATKSALAEGLLYIDGKPVSFQDYPFHYGIYDGVFPALLNMTSRQVGKSTLASNFTITESISIPFFKTLYVAPSREQTSKFSNTRLSKTLNYSPIIKKRFCSFEDTDNVFLKVLSNGSEISLSYATDDPDRIRGISADRIALDEVQDMDISAVLPVVKECAANSNYGYETYMGTPKSMENGIQHLWEQSSQTEWIMKCSGCNKYNFISDVKSIGLKGPICIKCGKVLSPREGQWYDMNPGVRLRGFHISQPMLPLNVENPARWERILDKMESYSPSKFKNEVLGVSDAIGTRMISKEELESLCDSRINIELKKNDDLLRRYRVKAFAGGVDWSGGGTTSASRTVCWVWGLLDDHRLVTLYYRVFPGRNQVEDVREVANVFQTFNCQLVCGDAGEGAVANAMLKELLGEHRVFQCQYGALAKQISWNGRDRWLLDRTAFIDSYMLFLKRKGAIFGEVRQMQAAINDILAEFEEVTQNGMGRKVWRHSPTTPDDALHAGLFGWVAMRILTGELQLYKNEMAQS